MNRQKNKENGKNGEGFEQPFPGNQHVVVGLSDPQMVPHLLQPAPLGAVSTTMPSDFATAPPQNPPCVSTRMPLLVSRDWGSYGVSDPINDE